MLGDFHVFRETEGFHACLRMRSRLQGLDGPGSDGLAAKKRGGLTGVNRLSFVGPAGVTADDQTVETHGNKKVLS